MAPLRSNHCVKTDNHCALTINSLVTFVVVIKNVEVSKQSKDTKHNIALRYAVQRNAEVVAAEFGVTKNVVYKTWSALSEQEKELYTSQAQNVRDEVMEITVQKIIETHSDALTAFQSKVIDVRSLAVDKIETLIRSIADDKVFMLKDVVGALDKLNAIALQQGTSDEDSNDFYEQVKQKSTTINIQNNYGQTKN